MGSIPTKNGRPVAVLAVLAALATGAWWLLSVGCGPPEPPAVQPSSSREAADTTMPPEPVKLFADRDWYRDHPAEERRWEGLLRRRQTVAGPGSRLGLDFEIDTDEIALPVYTARMEDSLEPFAGRRVSLRGKLVDLADEGFGLEIWPAAVELAEPRPE